MAPPRSFALVKSADQWRRAAHDCTALIGDVVQLAWVDDGPANVAGTPHPTGAGLTFDPHCRLFHSVPEEGRVERLLWAAEASIAPVDLFDADKPQQIGEFLQPNKGSDCSIEPRALAVDKNERLYIADARGRRILIYDLWSRRLLREVQVVGQPVDLSCGGQSVFVLLESPAAILELDARIGPRLIRLPAGVDKPSRLTISAAGELFVLYAATGQILAAGRPPIDVPGATDIEFQSDDVLVVARAPGVDFKRIEIRIAATDKLPGLTARKYDGRGIVRTPDGRIGFWTANGFRHAVAARTRYLREGRVTTFRLDSGEFQTFWGRVFLDACIPRDTSIRLHCIATDEPPDEAPLTRAPPANTGDMTVLRPDLSPPMPPSSLVPKTDAIQQALHRRETGRELPWSPMVAEDPFQTYEAPIATGTGRYLWITLLLKGNSRVTPRVRMLRAEFPSHDLMRRIPKTFSRDQEAADFLRRYIGLFDGFFGELEGESAARHALLDARGTPAELLPWLAGFIGLALDDRIARAPRPGGRREDARRQLIKEAIWLFRFRGTVRGLQRFLEIYVGVRPIVIEKFRVRGLGGALIGGSSALAANSVLGAGFRVGGAVGEADLQTISSNPDDAFVTHAHRFTVMLPAALGEEELAVVRNILDRHRPAHTAVEVCTVGAGMRVGRGLHVELTSIVGRTGGFESVQVENSVLGRGSIIGRPGAGSVPGASRLGQDSRVG